MVSLCFKMTMKAAQVRYVVTLHDKERNGAAEVGAVPEVARDGAPQTPATPPAAEAADNTAVKKLRWADPVTKRPGKGGRGGAQLFLDARCSPPLHRRSRGATSPARRLSHATAGCTPSQRRASAIPLALAQARARGQDAVGTAKDERPQRAHVR